MKKILVLLVMSLFVLSVNSSSALTINNKDMGYIVVSSVESSDVVPNAANISFSVETTDVDSKRATVRNGQISTNVINALKQELSSDKKSNIQTTNFTIRPNYKNNNSDDKTIINYTAINSLTVKTTDITKVSSLIDTAVKNNVTKVGNVSLFIENEEEYSSELVNIAVNKARTIANNTAATLNQKVVGVKTIRVNIYQQNANGVRMYKANAGATNDSSTLATPIEAGKTKLNVSVDAEFYVK